MACSYDSVSDASSTHEADAVTLDDPSIPPLELDVVATGKVNCANGNISDYAIEYTECCGVSN
jgi:hypothetical protein